MAFWRGTRVLVTGGGGFIGSHVIELLVAQGARVTVADYQQSHGQGYLLTLEGRLQIIDGDLRDPDQCSKVVHNQEVVLHLAAMVGGIGFNASHHGTMLRENILPTVNVLDAARQAKVERVLLVSSACVYSPHCSVPTREDQGFYDMPEPTNLGYGWAKRTVELLGQTYAKEFGMRVAIARPSNTYGPRDHFESPDAHVIASLIRRLMDGEDPLIVWGSGQQRRTFLYVEDLARGLIELIEKYPEPDPVNLGTEEETDIRTLAELIVGLSGKRVQLVFDERKPSGQPRRYCDSTKAKRLIGYTPQVSLREGLARTIAWYEEHRGAAIRDRGAVAASSRPQ